MVKSIMGSASTDRRTLAIRDNTTYEMDAMMDRARGGLNLRGFGPFKAENGNPFMNAGDNSPGKLHEYGKSISNSIRPCAPALAGHVTPLFDCSTSSSYPSGHTAKSAGASLLAAYLFPERFQAFIVRGQEYAQSRIVAGQHYTLDVMASRAMAYKAVADLLAAQVPDANSWLNNTANPARARQVAIDSCGGKSLMDCANTTGTGLYTSYAQQKAFYNYTKYYSWAPIGPADKPMVAPENSNYLIATRFPYLNKDQLLEVIRTTADPSGQVLDDPWSRINLFAAADGYGRFDTDVSVNLDSTRAIDQKVPGAGYFARDIWRNDISGPGKLVKAGDGSLELAGHNSFGGFELKAGELKLTGANQLTGSALAEGGTLSVIGGELHSTGDVTVNSAAVLKLDGARLSADHHLGIQGATQLDGSAQLDVAATASAGISGAISGKGGLVKTGAGRLELTNANTYQGNTQVAAGTLALGTSTSAGSGTLEMANGTTLAYANGIRVANAVLLDGTVTLRVDDGQAVQAGAIGGSGTFTLAGAGKLDIQGDLSGFTGLTRVSQGTVTASNALGGTVSIEGGGTFVANGPTTAQVTVGSGGTLKGSGSVGSTTVAQGGSVAPGNSPGTLRVLGDITFAPGSRYAFEVDPATGEHDLISVSGTAQLQGGTVEHIGLAGQYAPFSTYTLLTAAGGVTGRFDGVSSVYTFLTPQLRYGTNDVTLTLLRNDVRFASVAQTQNQAAVATAVDRTFIDPANSAGSALYSRLVTFDPGQARAAFDQLAGDVHASLQTAQLEAAQPLREAALDPLRDPAAFTTPGVRGWVRPFHGNGAVGGTAQASGLGSDVTGLLAGADIGLDERTRLGAYMGTSHAIFSASSQPGSANADSVHLGLYAGQQWGAFTLRGGLGYSWADLDTRRDVALPGFSERERASSHSGTLQGFVEGGYSLRLGRYEAEPFVNLAWVKLNSQGFHEKGGEAALAGEAGRAHAGFSTVGVRNRLASPFGQSWLHPELEVGWRHALGERDSSRDLALESSGAGYRVKGAALAQNVGLVRAALGADLNAATRLTVGYSGEFGEQGRRLNQADVQLQVQF
ncbi:autotransporter domain-containing protein [Pseudomonas caricapapayae]|uniref:autotransporter domain-containing protein n=1 Tax=Pseudomonas caricapapayae TaxID=46678 RepID=UPI001681A756|nr:autotransporter domain-containing protein [Pseudomonas caricapapayae]